MPFKWGPDLITNIPALDAHHQGIFNCINNFCEKCDENGGTEEILEVLDVLDRYTRTHFGYEEVLMKINNYPGLGDQKEQHALFLGDLTALKATLQTEGPSRQLTLLTKGKLIRWLCHHIKTKDRELVDFLNNR